MQTTETLSTPIRQGLRKFLLGAFAAATSFTASTASAGTGFNGPFNPVGDDAKIGAFEWLLAPYFGSPLPALTSNLSPDHTTLTIVLTVPAGNEFNHIDSAQFVNFPAFANFPNLLPPGPISYDYSVVFNRDVFNAELGFFGNAFDSGQRNSFYTAGFNYAAHVNAPTNGNLFFFIGFDSLSNDETTCTVTFTNLVWTDPLPKPAVNTLVYKNGDAVPGAGVPGSGVPTGAVFTTFGLPAINNAGQTAYIGSWKSPTGKSSGIFVNGAIVARLGQALDTGARLKAFKDPVIDGEGHVAFLATLMGTGITATNDTAVVGNAVGGALRIAAQEGGVAAGTSGAQWRSFTGVVAPGGGGGVIFTAQLVRAGSIIASNDLGAWAQDAMGFPQLVLHKGVSAIGGKTVKNFDVLKAVAGSPGQTHSFNNDAELISRVTFSDGTQAIVHSELP